MSVRPVTVIHVFLASLVIASTILAVSILPGLCLLPMFDMPRMHQSRELGLSTVVGLIVSAIVAIPIIILLKRRLW
jgi:hypothetical protein